MALQTFGKYDKEEAALAKKKAKLSAEMTRKKPVGLARVQDIKQEYFTQPEGSPLGAPTERQRTIQRQQGSGAAQGATPGAQTTDASGTGATTGTFQGKEYNVAELNKQGTLSPGASTLLKDRLASYAKASKTYREIREMQSPTKEPTRRGGITIGQTGGYGLLDKGRREQREFDMYRRGREEDIRASVRRGEMSSRSATAQLGDLSEEATSRNVLQSKTGIAAAEQATKRFGLGLKQQATAADIGIKADRLNLDQQKAEVDSYFRDISAKQAGTGLGTDIQRVAVSRANASKDILAKYSAAELTKDQAGFALSRIDPELAQELFGDVFAEPGQ